MLYDITNEQKQKLIKAYRDNIAHNADMGPDNGADLGEYAEDVSEILDFPSIWLDTHKNIADPEYIKCAKAFDHIMANIELWENPVKDFTLGNPVNQ